MRNRGYRAEATTPNFSENSKEYCDIYAGGNYDDEDLYENHNAYHGRYLFVYLWKMCAFKWLI